MNLSNTIIPKSDQLNADDLIAGPMTIKITGVDAGNAEQPVSIKYDGDRGRPYKPSKSMRRVLVTLWGTEGNDYIGKRITLYRDPNVKFGGDPVGGIKISHASDLEQSIQISLTEKRGKRAPHTVNPLPPEKASEPPPRPIDELTAAGDSISLSGMSAYQKWFSESLTRAERKLLADKHPGWKAIAEKAGA
jgi:hypothetical protein